MDIIKTGTLLLENGTILPKSLLLESETFGAGWTSVTNVRSQFERELIDSGWTFFFMANRLQATVFGFDRQKSVHTAVERIIANAEPQECNCLEITGVTMKSFFGLPYARVSAHARHVQGSSVFSS